MDDSAPPASDSEELPACPYCSQTHPPDRLKCPDTDMPLPLRGRELSGKFRFVRKLGKGGMASVWLAVNMSVDREVAIKVIRPEVLKNEDLVARFRSEAKAAGRIGHRNVCEILDFGVGPIGPYIVMESLRGTNLAQLIRERGKLPAEEAVGIVLEALDGLEAAHDRGIVHRDLKPENVFLHQPIGGDPVVKLMDFGVAKFTDGSAEVTTEHGALLGTPEYMAPEQFKGANLAEARTDIWAVGAILYRALTGKHPFKGPTVAATLLMVSHEEPTPIHEYAPDVPPTVVEVIARCMSKELEDRYADVAELRTALKAAMVFEESEDAAALPSLEGADAEALDTPVPEADDAPPAPEDSMMSRRPTEAFRVRPPSSRRLWWVVGGLALAGVAAVALWPEAPSTPAKQTAAAKKPAPEPQADPVVVPTTPADLGVVIEPEPKPKPEPDPEEVIEISAEPDVGSARPRSQDVPPPPSPDAFDDVDDADPSAAAPPEDVPLEDLPPGVVDLGGGYVLAKQRGKRSDHGDARKYCEALAVTAHMGFTGWKLPFPGLVKRIKEAGAVPRGTYWTSARWRGNVTTFTLPSGDTRKGVNAERRSARTLCVAEADSRQSGS